MFMVLLISGIYSVQAKKKNSVSCLLKGIS